MGFGREKIRNSKDSKISGQLEFKQRLLTLENFFFHSFMDLSNDNERTTDFRSAMLRKMFGSQCKIDIGDEQISSIWSYPHRPSPAFFQ